MLKKTIIIMFITGLFGLSAGNNFISENFNLKNMALSDSYRYLIAKKDVLLFIKYNSMNKSKKNNVKQYLIQDYSKLCHDLYYGNDFLIKNKRESTVCLKYGVLEGYYSSAKHLSEFSLKENRILDSIYWAGIASGFGVDMSSSSVYLKHISKSPKLRAIFELSVKESVLLTLKNYNNIYEGELDFKDMYYDSNNDIEIYELLKIGDFDSLSIKLSERTNEAQKLILLSHTKNKDWKSLIEFCEKYMSQKLNQYCLKSLNKYTDSDFPQVKYSLNEFKIYKNNKLRAERLTNALESLGYSFEEGNKYSKMTLDSIISELKGDELVKGIQHFNVGRKIYHTKRISKK
jgi:hypothetical protein